MFSEVKQVRRQKRVLTRIIEFLKHNIFFLTLSLLVFQTAAVLPFPRQLYTDSVEVAANVITVFQFPCQSLPRSVMMRRIYFHDPTSGLSWILRVCLVSVEI